MQLVGFEPTKLSHGILRPAPLTAREQLLFHSTLFITSYSLGFILLVALQLVIGGLVDLEILNINEEFILVVRLLLLQAFLQVR